MIWTGPGTAARPGLRPRTGPRPVRWRPSRARVPCSTGSCSEAGQEAGADTQVLAALLVTESSGERAVSPAGALGLMQLIPDKFRPGDDPFDVRINLLRAAQHVAVLQGRYRRWSRWRRPTSAASTRRRITDASDGAVTGSEYVARFRAALGCLRAASARRGRSAPLVSPIGMAITPANISFGFLDDYGGTLATAIRGAHGVQRYGTLHLAWDLVVPGAPSNGRGYPVFAPLAGRITRTNDPAGGPFGLWIDNPTLDLRARLMHLDGLAPRSPTAARCGPGSGSAR